MESFTHARRCVFVILDKGTLKVWCCLHAKCKHEHMWTQFWAFILFMDWLCAWFWSWWRTRGDLAFEWWATLPHPTTQALNPTHLPVMHWQCLAMSQHPNGLGNPFHSFQCALHSRTFWIMQMGTRAPTAMFFINFVLTKGIHNRGPLNLLSWSKFTLNFQFSSIATHVFSLINSLCLTAKREKMWCRMRTSDERMRWVDIAMMLLFIAMSLHSRSNTAMFVAKFGCCN